MTQSVSSRRPSFRLTLLAAAPWILTLFTVIVLVSDAGLLASGNPFFGTEFVLYMVLTIMSLVFAVTLSQSELSMTHMVGIVAFLSSPVEAVPVITWALASGSVLGLLLRRALVRDKREPHQLSLTKALFVIARVILSFRAAAQLYIFSGVWLPLGRLPDDMSGVLLPLVIYGLVYITLYMSIFLLELYSEDYPVRNTIRDDLATLAVILILPIPFAILGAEILSELTLASRIVLLTGLIFIMIALYALSLSDFRLRRQIGELQNLATVTQVMRSHLGAQALVQTIYDQVRLLLNIDNFVFALKDPETGAIEYPLMMVHGQPVSDQSAALPSGTIALVEGVISGMQPVMYPARDAALPQALTDASQPAGAVHSWLGVPLEAAGQVLGAIAVFSVDPRSKFNRDDLRLLNIVAASSSIALENARLYREQTERAEQLVILNRISSLLSGTLSPDKVLDTVISSGSAISNATAVAVYLYWDDARSTMPLVRSAGLGEAFIANAPDAIAFQIRNGKSGTLPAVIAPDIRRDTRAEQVRDVLLLEQKLALVELPMEIGDETLGVLGFYYNSPQQFSNDHIELLKMFVNQAAQAINNARMYASTDEAFQRSVEQLLSLASIGRVLTSTIDLKNICDLVLTQVSESTRIDTGMVILKDELTERLMIVSRRGYPPEIEARRDIIQTGVHASVLASGEVVRIDDLRDQAAVIPLVESTLSILGVPILRGRDVLGAIYLESNRTGGFTEEDSYFVTQIANQAVIAIDNARLFTSITEAHDRLRVLLDAMEEGIILVDAQGQVALANPRIDLIGVRQAQLIDRNLADLLDVTEINIIECAGFASREDVLDFITHLRNPRPYAPVNYVVQGEHGVLHIRRQIVPVRDVSDAIIGVLLVFYNKTEEEELARAREELSRMIVHDLRSPLTAVTTSLRLLQELVPKDAPHYPSVTSTTDASRRAIRKLLNRVDSLLDISRMESGQLSIDAELAELLPLIHNVQQELAPLAQELAVTIEAKVDRDLPPLDIDGDKVERLILNLVDNALKYTAQGSTITVRNHRPGEDGAAPGFVRIDVADRGPGVPPEYKQTLFDRFVQIEGRRKVRRGVGLGLTFCRLVTEAHGGTIWIEDHEGGGSVFAFTLPVANLTRDEDDGPEE